MLKALSRTLVVLAFAGIGSASANGLGENTPWQFQTTAEMANRAYIEDLRRKQRSGYYNAPTYNTFIDNQNNFNCSNSASSSGNGGTNSATANTPNSTGPTGSATGSQSSASVSGMQNPFETVLNNTQENWGPVGTNVVGDSLATASGNLTRQVLNTVQDNSGVQDASINGSSACAFASVTGVSK
ncbi:MAG: hypothetical protein ACKOXK_11590 [Chakrabartia sp.]